MGYIYISQKVAICSLWTVCPCLCYKESLRKKFLSKKNPCFYNNAVQNQQKEVKVNDQIILYFL